MWAEEPETPEEWMMRKEALDVSRSIVECMSERELGVVRHVANGEAYDVVGERYGISRNRAWQIVDLALRKLRAAHSLHGSWVELIDSDGLMFCHPSADSESALEPIPNALCTRCTDPFRSSSVGYVRWCDACRAGRCQERNW